ncbi:MAG: hypothetical protein HOK75_07505 [Phycisphaerae bacterium]|jgi:hypothetical protein|nr:hypothetical protein [Phycisphaerae bacterium]|tara:strand:+ start:2038 stop:2202 length:165 start_codon:yes stop_codon:yes gene_type:complete
MKWFIVIGVAVVSALLSVLVAKSLGVKSVGAIGGAAGGAAGAVVAIQMAKKKLR